MELQHTMNIQWEKWSWNCHFSLSPFSVPMERFVSLCLWIDQMKDSPKSLRSSNPWLITSMPSQPSKKGIALLNNGTCTGSKSAWPWTFIIISPATLFISESRIETPRAPENICTFMLHLALIQNSKDLRLRECLRFGFVPNMTFRAGHLYRTCSLEWVCLWSVNVPDQTQAHILHKTIHFLNHCLTDESQLSLGCLPW